MNSLEPIFFESGAEWRDWLEENHAAEKELLLGFRRTRSKLSGITYQEALDEALCFGWIDGVRKSRDEISYTIRFTPRRKGSIWSQVNLKRIEVLREQGLLHPAGIAMFESRDPRKVMKYSSENRPEALDPESEREFREHPEAWAFFQAQPPGYRMVMTWIVIGAKQDATRRRRLAKLIEASARGERIR